MTTKNDSNNLEIMRHSVAHVLATAVLEMFPEAKFAMVPPLKTAFIMILNCLARSFRKIWKFWKKK